MDEFKEILGVLLDREALSQAQMTGVMERLMNGQLSDAQIGGFLIALRMKGETIDEIVAAANVMRSLASRVEVSQERLIDTCGTGGDSIGSFNISTVSAIVAAAAGARVAKHGNRSVSSKSGSADVLEIAGVNLSLGVDDVARCIHELGIGFLFAPAHHGAMKHAVGPRKDLGSRTIFNLLGPLTNPAGAKRQLMGVFHSQWIEPIAHSLHQLGSEHVMVVHSEDGMDEISIAGNTYVAELKAGQVKRWLFKPEDYGFKLQPLESLRVNTAQESLAKIDAVLKGEQGPARDIVVLNAAAAIYVSGVTSSIEAGIVKAKESIDNAAALNCLNDLVRLTRELSDA